MDNGKESGRAFFFLAVKSERFSHVFFGQCICSIRRSGSNIHLLLHQSLLTPHFYQPSLLRGYQKKRREFLKTLKLESLRMLTNLIKMLPIEDTPYQLRVNYLASYRGKSFHAVWGTPTPRLEVIHAGEARLPSQ